MVNAFYKAHKVYGMSKNYHIDRAQGPEPHAVVLRGVGEVL